MYDFETLRLSKLEFLASESRLCACGLGKIQNAPSTTVQQAQKPRTQTLGGRIRGTLGDADPLNKVTPLKAPEGFRV